MSLKSKVASLFVLGQKSQKSYCESRGFSVQAFSQSLKRESISLEEMVKVASFLDGELAITIGDQKVVFTTDDFTEKVDKRKLGKGYFKTKKVVKDVKDMTIEEIINSL